MVNYTVIKMQARCPKCRKNVNGIVRANKYKHGFPHVCESCYKNVENGGETNVQQINLHVSCSDTKSLHSSH